MLAANNPALFNTSPLLTTSEAARYLRLSAPTLERLRCTGEGPPFIKLGPGIRARVAYRLSDLETFINQNRRLSTGDAGDAT